MERTMCKKCQSKLIQIGNKYVCSNETCDFQELLTSKNWYESLMASERDY